jgi:hypothetical protein
VKTPSRKAAGVVEQRRNELQSDRAKAPAMRDTFPDIGVVHIDLRFAGGPGLPLSPQRHSLYPAARAFFRFACPCTDCDGDFNLTATATELAKAGTSSKRSDRSASGQMTCPGTRWRDSTQGEACRIELSFKVSIDASTGA